MPEMTITGAIRKEKRKEHRKAAHSDSPGQSEEEEAHKAKMKCENFRRTKTRQIKDVRGAEALRVELREAVCSEIGMSVPNTAPSPNMSASIPHVVQGNGTS